MREDYYISLKCGIPDTVHQIIAGNRDIIIDGIYTLSEKLKKGQVVFVTIGGDKGKKEVDWEPGFAGIAHVVREPYDYGYGGNDKYFKTDICVDIIFPNVFKREDFINYQDAFDAAYIGPELSRDPSQAISTLEMHKAVAVIRAVLDKYPQLQRQLEEVFPAEFLERVFGAVRMLIPAMVEFGEDLRTAVQLEFADAEEKNGIRLKYGENLLFYGVPGAGKSFAIDGRISGASYERVVFHPDYTYSDFVGQIMPRLKKDPEGNEKLSYQFVPGPFTKAMKKAVANPNEMFYLVIEEINRGNAPAIFGDIFQLLDREDDGTGKYSITNFDIAKEVYDDEDAEIKIPSNLSLLATMNTSDQNAFTLDTAFQRRWDMQYIPNDVEGAKHAHSEIEGSGITWGQFASVINQAIIEHNVELSSFEDKQLGAYFAKASELAVEKFPEKVLKYLWDDAFKLERDKVFVEDIKSIGDLISAYANEARNGNNPIKRVMKVDIYNRMMDMSAASIAEAIDESEVYETETYVEEN